MNGGPPPTVARATRSRTYLQHAALLGYALLLRDVVLSLLLFLQLLTSDSRVPTLLFLQLGDKIDALRPVRADVLGRPYEARPSLRSAPGIRADQFRLAFVLLLLQHRPHLHVGRKSSRVENRPTRD